MALANLTAVAHPDGNRIDLAWRADDTATGVRVVRRAGRYPAHPDDGVVVVHDAIDSASDVGVTAEQTQYYALFPWQGDPPVYESGATYRVGALATAPHGNATYMLNALPAIYRRYDATATMLQRFLELVGGQLDQLQSLAQYSRQLQNAAEVPGELLPLLGDWIGWRTDYKRPLDAQRDEIENAPAIYQRMGLLPTVEATVKRISGWDSRSKEYVHNVFASNRPERLNLWALERQAGGAWSANEQLLSTDYVYDGRAAHAVDDSGLHWLVYHTERKGRWEIWAKSSAYAELASDLSAELAAGTISLALWSALVAAGVAIEQDAVLTANTPNVWRLADGPLQWIVERLPTALRVYRSDDTVGPAELWSASEPVVVDADPNACNKHPTLTAYDSALWLFWAAYDDQSRWQIHYRRRVDARWSDIGPADPETAADLALNPFAELGVYAATRQRRSPVAAVDDSNRLWIFWLELNGTRWQLRYNRRDAGVWGEPLTMPNDGGVDPRVEDDLMVLVTPAPTTHIYVCWSRYAPIASGEIRRQVAIRRKVDQDLTTANWGAIRVLPKAAVDDHHDREPFALFEGATLHVFWSSNRGASGWSIWRRTLLDIAVDSWGAAERVTEPVYAQRAPLPLLVANRLWLLFRGSRHIPYRSTVYRITTTRDERYAGSRSVDVRHQEQIVLRNRFADPQRYTYDLGPTGDARQRTDNERISRDTIGEFLQPDTIEDGVVEQGIARLRPVMREFMPMTDRAVFTVEESTPTEYVYTYDVPPSADARYIVSTYSDEWTGASAEAALGPDEDFSSVLDS